jgi:hypothetical protein
MQSCGFWVGFTFPILALLRHLPGYCGVNLNKLIIRPLCVPLLEVFLW